jgi:hypothetical protein
MCSQKTVCMQVVRRATCEQSFELSSPTSTVESGASLPSSSKTSSSRGRASAYGRAAIVGVVILYKVRYCCLVYCIHAQFTVYI